MAAVRNKKRRYLLILLLILLLRFLPLGFVEKQAHVRPDYPKEDLSRLLEKDRFSDQDYQTIYQQSGLGKTAVDKLLERENGKKSILNFQEKFFQKVKIVCEPNSIISNEERLVDDRGKTVQGTQFADLQNGYVLLTKSSHTFWWRNGHAAIVVDAERGETLESVVLGSNSCIQDVNKWLNYPNFIVLKLKDADPLLLDRIASFAKTYLNDIPYALTSGVFRKKYEPSAEISGTQCAHLIWRAFIEYGFDLDSNGGSIVTPKDIVNSQLFEVVQLYGMHPRRPW